MLFHSCRNSAGGKSLAGRCTSVIARLAPWLANLRAVARPTPLMPPAPVTRATFPFKLPIFHTPLP